jgi:hypothetical protein
LRRPSAASGSTRLSIGRWRNCRGRLANFMPATDGRRFHRSVCCGRCCCKPFTRCGRNGCRSRRHRSRPITCTTLRKSLRLAERRLTGSRIARRRRLSKRVTSHRASNPRTILPANAEDECGCSVVAISAPSVCASTGREGVLRTPAPTYVITRCAHVCPPNATDISYRFQIGLAWPRQLNSTAKSPKPCRSRALLFSLVSGNRLHRFGQPSWSSN